MTGTMPRGGTLIISGYIGSAQASTAYPKKIPSLTDYPQKIPSISGIPKKIIEILAYPKKIINFLCIDKCIVYWYKFCPRTQCSNKLTIKDSFNNQMYPGL